MQAQQRRYLTQLLLDESDVPRTHAQELLLGGRQPFEPWIDEDVGDDLLPNRNVVVDARHGQQGHNRLRQHRIEISVRISQSAVRVYDARLERQVQTRRSCGVQPVDGGRVLVVAVITSRIEQGDASC